MAHSFTPIYKKEPSENKIKALLLFIFPPSPIFSDASFTKEENRIYRKCFVIVCQSTLLALSKDERENNKRKKESIFHENLIRKP